MASGKAICNLSMLLIVLYADKKIAFYLWNFTQTEAAALFLKVF